MKVVETILVIVIFLVLMVLIWAGLGLLIMWLWNLLIASTFTVPTMTFLQGFGLVAFTSIIRLIFFPLRSKT